jgi:hypothetical protein
MVCSSGNSSSVDADPGFRWAPSTEPGSPGWGRREAAGEAANTSTPIVDLWDTDGPAYGQNNSLQCSQANQTGWVRGHAVCAVCTVHSPCRLARVSSTSTPGCCCCCSCKYEDELFAERVLRIIAAQVWAAFWSATDGCC